MTAGLAACVVLTSVMPQSALASESTVSEETVVSAESTAEDDALAAENTSADAEETEAVDESYDAEESSEEENDADAEEDPAEEEDSADTEANPADVEEDPADEEDLADAEEVSFDELSDASEAEESDAATGDIASVQESDADATEVSAQSNAADVVVEAESTSLSAPAISSVSGSLSSRTVTWDAVDDAAGYMIYRSTATLTDSTMSDDYLIGTVSSDVLTFKDTKTLSQGTVYYYYVAAYTEESDTQTIGTLSSVYPYVSLASCTADSTAVNTASGIKVKWSKVTGATGYYVYRKVSGGDYGDPIQTITSGSTVSFTDTTAKSGTVYYYRVKAYYTDGSITITGKSDNAVKARFLATPVLKTPSVTTTGTNVKWKAVSGATGYVVYYSTTGKSGSWKQVGKTTDTYYKVDESELSVSSGTKIYYTVRAYKGSYNTAKADKYNSLYWSYRDSTGVTSTYLAASSSAKATAVSSGTKLSWKAVKGATGYGIWRKKSGGSWELIKTTTSTSYTDKSSLTAGATYYYRIRAYKGSVSKAKASLTSTKYWGCSVQLKSVYLKAPTLKSAKAGASGTKITWSKVTGATGYAVLRKKSGSSKWTFVGTTTSTSYTDKSSSLTDGATYYYTVRAYKGKVSTAKSNKYLAAYWGNYNTTGLKTVYLDTPTLKSTSITSSKYVKVTWSSVSKATGYAVWRKEGSSGSWKLIGTTTSTSYTDKSSLTSHKTYYYTVLAYKGSLSTAKANKYNAKYWSGYDKTGVKFDCIKNSDGTLISDSAMYKKAQSRSSSTKWLILVDCTKCRVGIFYGSKGNWDMKYYFACSPGKSSTPTVKGEFTVKSKGKSFGTSSYTCWYYTQFYGNYLFHSVLYYPGSMTKVKDGRLGQNLSHGCVCLSISNAKWIYDNIPIGTKVYIY